ncbi:adhesion G protein-coupled receptor F5 [Halichoeres trimaculatus]|uniref:adhesion G protein-coupled receptor F5 n=1 Tax=Halichoeres trimaculatus TaxID=147232 RepID=UPI003D9E9EA6
MPHLPVDYNSQQTLTCSVQHKLDASVYWQLKRDGRDVEVTNGRELAEKNEDLNTSIILRNTSELWAGEYTCMYRQESDCVITHKASGFMDVCLKPNIYISINPSFPHCKDSSDVHLIEAGCEIGNSSENYTVTWSGVGVSAIVDGVSEEGVFTATTAVSCSSTTPQPQLTCTFENRCNQSTSASIEIHMIQARDRFCESEGDWQKTKANFTASLRCKDKPGIRQRKCSSDGKWESEDSECVNTDLYDVLQQASIVDIGQGLLDKNAEKVMSRLERATTNTESINTFSNLNASVSVLHTLSEKLQNQNDTMMDDFLGSSSNLLEKSLEDSWEVKKIDNNVSLAERYLLSVEKIIHVTNITHGYEKKNVEVASQKCSEEKDCVNKVLNTTVKLKGDNPGSVVTAGFKELQSYLPIDDEDYEPNSFVISTTTEKNLDLVEVEINFALLKPRPPHVQIKCVAWDNRTHSWSDYKCEWKGSEGSCECKHLSSFCILMGKFPIKVRYLTEMTYVGLSVSIISLTISLVIELIVWSAVVKTSTSYLRHTAHVNICLCLLVADCCFLASSKPEDLSYVWCKTSVVLKHFCYLAMFFWMLWLSSTLLHQTVFLFHNVSKKNYLRLSALMGYVCPLLIVTVTIIANKGGAEGQYYSKETCWLVYTAPFKGSIHTFVIPVGIIAFFNVFAMLVVIMKLLDHPKTISPAFEKEKKAIVTVMRTVVLLTPIFGVTWVFGFAVMFLDLTYGIMANFANYAFVLLNAFQGFFILLTICLGDTMTREELLRRLKIRGPAPPNDSCTDSTTKK